MDEGDLTLGHRLDQLVEGDWLDAFVEIAETHGHWQALGDDHFAALVEDGQTLLVTFETLPMLRTTGRPLGWKFVTEQGWSHLCLVSDGDTWFRDPVVYGYFDRLSDDGFFEDFDRVLFYGAGPCGYAAAAFSVAAPGARVLAVAPQATLDPGQAGWDDRFPRMRRTDFDDRYGYAPDMVEAADAAWIVYDPAEPMDAMHAALYRRPHVTALPFRWIGAGPDRDLAAMDLLPRMIAQAADGTLTRDGFNAMLRARRTYPPYLRRLLGALERRHHPELAAALCRHVVARMKAPRFARRLSQLETAAAARRAARRDQAAPGPAAPADTVTARAG